MIKEHTLERYLEALLEGNRNGCRAVIEETLQSGVPANRVYMDVIWPVMVEIEKLQRNERITNAQEAFATRINRTIVDQLQNKLPRNESRNSRVAICSAPEEHAELGAQMTADMFESDGWEVRFLGGHLDNDEILSFIHDYKPQILVLYGVRAMDAPAVRELIDKIKTIGAFPEMQIILSGGVFARAEGLWEEIGADMYAQTAAKAVQIAQKDKTQLPTPERMIKRRKRSTVLATANTEMSVATS